MRGLRPRIVAQGIDHFLGTRCEGIFFVDPGRNVVSIVVSIFVFLWDRWGVRGDATVVPKGKNAWKGKGHGGLSTLVFSIR